MEVLSVASEVFPLVKTGGLADVAGALPGALADEGVHVRTLLPGYASVRAALPAGELVAGYDNLFGGSASLRAIEHAGLDLLILDAPHLYAREGGPYADAEGRDWPDNAQRFAALARVAADLGAGAVQGYAPAVVHGHDWQAGLMPAYLHYRGGARPGTVMTIHNLAFQGQFPASLVGALGLPAHAYATDGVEYYGSLGFLKAAVLFADHVTTVSPSYAEEISGPGGMGMQGLLRGRGAAFSGILNGLDTTVWNPANDAAIAVAFDARRLSRRAANKVALQRQLGLTVSPASPVFGVISRLTWQKGMDLLLAALPTLLKSDGQLALLGSGEPAIEHGFGRLSGEAPGQVGVRLGYDEALAHLIQAGCDALVVPSRFEPCGLTQLAALRYGALPIVSHVGGLADTVIDANEAALAAGVATGWHFSPVTSEALTAALDRALRVWPDRPAWQAMQRRAMASDVGWTRPAKRYAALYREVARR